MDNEDNGDEIEISVDAQVANELAFRAGDAALIASGGATAFAGWATLFYATEISKLALKAVEGTPDSMFEEATAKIVAEAAEWGAKATAAYNAQTETDNAEEGK